MLFPKNVRGPASANVIITNSHPIASTFPPSTAALATRDKIVPTRTGMRHCQLKDTIRVENDPIRTWATAGVRLIALEDGELLIRAGIGKGEAFVVVEGVRIVVAADGLTIGVVVAALVHCFINV